MERSTATAAARSFDADRIGELMQTIVEHNAAWEAWFTSCGIDPLRVRYQELDADMAGVTEGILNFFGIELPDGRRVVPRHKRQANGLNDQWIDRYGRSRHSTEAPPSSACVHQSWVSLPEAIRRCGRASVVRDAITR
ncbi:Stf0 family sulfotransferase [Streptomyces sp. NPDC008222]|uniref:Stf0 family sulfotransferase n=1 Tax=Streptomyces sp. NPDC008222 TaxID=3364820 RepID=UPI0036EAD424